MNKRWIAVGLVVILAIGGFAYWQRQAKSAATRSNPQYVTAVARRATLEVSINGTANLVAGDKRTVRSAVAGTVSAIHVEDGQPVKEGQTVMTIQNEELLELLENARIDLESQRLRLTNFLSPTAIDRSTAELKVLQAETTLTNRRNDLKKLEVVSPVSGRVSNVRVNRGDSVNSGQILMSVGDDTDILVMAQVVQADITKVKVGQKATAVFGTEFPSAQGTVFSIGAEGAASGRNIVIPVAIKVPNTQGVYRSGLTANVTIYVAPDDAVYAIGTVAPVQKYDVRAELQATIAEVLVRDGDSVAVGQPIVRLSQDNLNLLIKQAENDLRIATENLRQIEKGYAPNVSENDVRQQELRVRQSEQTYKKRLSDVEALSVKSPINGLLVTRSASVGDTIAANAVLFGVADYSKMLMVIPVDELDVTSVKVGQRATINIDALPGRRITGEVTKVATEGTVRDGIANYDVTITITETQGLRGSLSGNATIQIARKENALVVPAEAVRTAGNRKRVMILKDGAPVQVDVTIGLTNDTMTEILSGVQEGDTVVISSVDRSRPQVNTPFNRGPAVITK